MNRLERELLALRKTAGIYLRYRRNPEDYSKRWVFEKKEEGYMEWRLKHASNLKKFHNLHEGKDCFILGNGPSLNQMDLEQLKGQYTFGLNKIYLIFKRIQLKLNYLVSVNPYVIEQSEEQYRELSVPKFLSFTASRNVEPGNHTYYLYTKDGFDFCENLQEPVNEGATVTFVALQLAYYMGFKRVFLIGVDHNYKQKGNPNELQTLEGTDTNHFDPDYFRNLQWQLADLEASEISYRLAKLYYERTGRQIIDATVGGKLEIFPKIEFGDALELSGGK